jgi:hypothetical protein
METMLNSLKVDLGITSNVYDERLIEYLQSAMRAIAIEGIELDVQNIEDANLVIMYAGWLWNKRRTGEGMPRMLRWQMNNRLFSGKV